MKNRIIVSLIAIFFLGISSPIQVDAYQDFNSEETIEMIVPCADSIVYKYRVYNGKRQYRRWNETRGYWVDSSWITLG